MRPPPAAFVTGASSGIGQAIARRLARTHEVWLSYRERRAAAEAAAAEIVRAGGRAAAVHLDLCDPASIGAARRAFVAGRRAAGAEPRLDALVNNAASAGPGYRLLLEIDEEEWDAVWRANVTGPARLVAEWQPLLAPEATLVNVSSIVARAGSIAHKSHAHYATTKAVLNGFLRGWQALPENRRRRAVNVLAGMFDTAMFRDHVGGERDRVAAAVPLGRIGEAEEVAALVAFAVSPAGVALAGQDVVIDGGWLRRGWRRLPARPAVAAGPAT